MCLILSHIAAGRDLKYCFVFTALAFFGTQGFAQTQLQKRADKFYEAQQYHVAAQLYERLLAEDTTHYYAAYRLGHCQRELFAYEEAEKHFAYLAKNAAQYFPASLFYYARALMRKEDFSSAIHWYENYLSLPERQLDTSLARMARSEKASCLEAMLLPSVTEDVLVERLPDPVNTDYQEFAPVFYGGDSVLLFSSSRPQAKGPRSNRSGQRFTDQYLFQADSSSWRIFADADRLGRLNSDGSEASGSFTADMRTYYFTRCGERGGNCRIYRSIKSKGHWQPPQLLPEAINQMGTNSKHPFVTASGDSLFFVSDREGGFGKTDIWLSAYDPQKGWQKARNLGAEINSSQDEIFPFYHQSEDLFIFGSDGHDGPGGMDLYMTKLENTTKSNLLPLEAPFNTAQDDCCLVFGKSLGYLASNRDGNFDIYSFSKEKDQSLRQLLMGIAPASSRQPLVAGQSYNEVITDHSLLMDNDREYLSVMHSDRQNYMSNGSSRFVLSADVNDIMLEQLRDEEALLREDSLQSGIRMTDSASSPHVLASFSTRQIDPDDQVEINGRILYADNFQVVPELRLYLLNQQGEVIKITTTNQEGAFRFINLQPASAFQIVDADAEGERKLRLSYQLSSYGSEVKTLKFENIYFDFNQAGLRNEAQIALDELVEYHREHPSAVIEINAFTDTTGNDIYNLQLSRERGLAAFNYLLEADVDRSSLVINARGASTTAFSSNSFVSQQLNRRVELYITGNGLDYKSEIVTRMLRPRVTLNMLSSRTGMSKEDIRRLNGNLKNELKAYKPLRLYGWAVQQAPSLFYQMTVRSEN